MYKFFEKPVTDMRDEISSDTQKIIFDLE